MYSRLKANSEKLYEVFLHCERKIDDDDNGGVGNGNDTGRRQGKVIKFYPDTYNDEEVMTSSVKFAFPYTTPSRDHSSEYYTFVLTDIGGKFKYGFCKLTTRLKLETCYCFVSFLPYFEVFYQALEIVTNRLGRDADDGIAMQLLQKLHQTTTFNPLDEICVVMLGFSQRFNFLCPSLEPVQSIPENKNISKLFTSFGVNNLMHIFASTIFERRLLLFSKHLNKVTSCIHGLSVLIYPLIWQHLFIPILPPLLIDYCSAPMPYIIGLHSSTMEKLGHHDYCDAVVVNIDDDVIMSQHDDLKLIPQDVVSMLKKQLKHHKSSLDKNQPIGDGVSRAFLRAMAYLIGGYRNALRFKIGDPITFNRDAFISGISLTGRRQGGSTTTATPAAMTSSSSSSSLVAEYKRFYSIINQTQLFQEFVQERLDMLNSGSGFQDDFEREAMLTEKDDKWMTQSRYKDWMGHMKEQGKKIKREGKDKWSDFSQKVKHKGKKTWKEMKLKIEDRKRDDYYDHPYHRKVISGKEKDAARMQQKVIKPPRPPPPIVEKSSQYNFVKFSEGLAQQQQQPTSMSILRKKSTTTATTNHESGLFRPLAQINSNLLDEPAIQQCLKITTAEFSETGNQLKKFYSLEGLCSSASDDVIRDVNDDDDDDDDDGGDGGGEVRKMNGGELEEADVINAPVLLLMMSERQRKGSLYRKSQSSFELDKLSSPTTKNDNSSNLNHNNNNNKITISNDDDDDDEDEGTDDRFQITNFGVNSDVNMLKIANNIHNNINNNINNINNNMMPKNSSFNDSLIYYSSVRKTTNNINKTSTLPALTSNNSAITQQQQQQRQQQQQQHQQPPVTSAEDLITFGSSDSSCISIEFDPLKQQQNSTASLNSNDNNNNNTNIANINATITNNDDTFNNNNKTSPTTTTDEGPPLAPIRPSRMKPVARVTRPVNTISTDLLPSTTVPHQYMPPQLAPPQLTPPQPMPRRRDTTNTSYNHHRVNTYMSQSSAHSRNGVVISDWIDCVATDAATAATTAAVTATAATTSTATIVAATTAGSGADEKASQNYVDVIFDLNCLVKSVNDKLGDNNSINSSNTSNNNNNINNTNIAKQGSTAVTNATTNIPPNFASSTSFLPTTTSFGATTKTSSSSLSPPRQTRQSLAEQIKQARTAFIQSDLTIPIPPPGFDSFDPLSTGQLIIDDQSRSGSTNSDQSKLSIFHLEPSQRSSADLNQASRLDDQLLREWNLLTLTSSSNATTTTTTTTTSLQPQQPVTSYQYNKSMPDLVSQLQQQQQQQQLHQQPHHKINNSSKMLTQQQLQQLYTQRQMPPQYQQQHQQRPNSRFYLKPQLVPYPCQLQSSTSSPTNTQYQISNMIRIPNYFSPDFSPTTQKYSTLPHFTVPARFYANFDKNTLTTNTDSNTNSGIGTLLFGAPSFEARSVARKLCAMSTNNTATNNNKDNTNNNSNNVNNNNKNKEWEKFD